MLIDHANIGGSYILILVLKNVRRIRIGSLGFIRFPAGCVFYVGNAKKGLKQRVMRHIKSKAKHWHIDYLKAKARITDVILITDNRWDECALSAILKKKFEMPVKKFGSSDCSCDTHLFFSPQINSSVRILANYLKSYEIKFELIKIDPSFSPFGFHPENLSRIDSEHA